MGGDVVLFFTDGLFEAVNEANMEFGEERLAVALARSCEDQPLQRLLDEVVSERVERFDWDPEVCRRCVRFGDGTDAINELEIGAY